MTSSSGDSFCGRKHALFTVHLKKPGDEARGEVIRWVMVSPDGREDRKTKALRLKEGSPGNRQEKFESSRLGLARRQNLTRRDHRKHPHRSRTTLELDGSKLVRGHEAPTGLGVGEVPGVPGLDDTRPMEGPLTITEHLPPEQLVVEGLLGGSRSEVPGAPARILRHETPNLFVEHPAQMPGERLSQRGLAGPVTP
jgi:hypothetical protein